MRISKIRIKNFKSIDHIGEVKLLDNSIACIIGKNGSGKSNFIHALYALKKYQNLNDNQRYEKAKKDEEILISATICLELKDEIALNEYDLSLKDLSSFTVTLTKKLNSNPEIAIEAVDFNKEFDEKANKLIKKIKKSLDSESQLFVIPSPSEEIPEKDQSENVIEASTKTPEETEKQKITDKLLQSLSSYEDGNYLDKQRNLNLIEISEQMCQKQLIQNNPEELLTNIEEAKKLINFDVNSFIKEKLWNKLQINLLDLRDYQVESLAKKSELRDTKKHPFLSDLLYLSGKTIDDFDLDRESLENNCEDASNKLSDELSSIWKQHKINFKVTSQNSNIYFSFETPQKRKRSLEDLSDGEQWFLRFYTKLAIATNRKDQIIWLFDEPGQSLHATSQIDLKEFFENTANSSQIIYSSHQPMMIQWQRLERIFIVENDKKSGTKVTTRFWTDEDLISPLREALGLFVGEQFLTGVQHVVVEGVSDYIHLQGWLLFFQRTRVAKHWSEENSQFNRTIIPAGSRDSIPLYLLFLTKKLKGKISSIGIPDGTKDAEKIKTALTNYGLEPAKKRVRSISELVSDAKLKDVEELYTTNEFLKITQEFYSETYPKVKFSEKFLSPTVNDLENGLINYIDNQLSKENQNYFEDSAKTLSLDKPGVAMFIYERLNNNKLQLSKETEKKFEKIFTSLNQLFKDD